MIRSWIFLLTLPFLAFSHVALGQTRCPIGTQMGSMQCIPDTPEMRGGGSDPAPTGEWVKTWGAIAMSKSTGDVGTTKGKLSQGDAKSSAIQQCSKNGADDCKVTLVYRNQCAALAASQHSTFSQASASKDVAISQVINICERSGGGACKVVFSECSDPFFKKY
ncbi:DUF4189 domain-containing protein [Xanthomonas prunicola]|uniref:DUF4189 domain-containing protein n=1 Tax=Xanthomonas prunicola TaxID=2053930 RepID=A0A2N3RM51_9XANT|nr:DUF4189 domain-containing protein [Xanthomonas prunicola]PKV13573.1 hypothetical protein XpruCFBP8353_00040 [Xanthomonas prunicola]PKV17851.1 hypothetical protein XpruCFBP8354_00040 [Xanthomonas prunicola]PKV22836.1 hypothetical protein CVO74_06420 [Xanthomonas prunicola]